MCAHANICGQKKRKTNRQKKGEKVARFTPQIQGKRNKSISLHSSPIIHLGLEYDSGIKHNSIHNCNN